MAGFVTAVDKGFIIEDERGHWHHFESRAALVEAVVNRAWAERLRVSVEAEVGNPEPRRITLLRS
jgi:hypothetical protein